MRSAERLRVKIVGHVKILEYLDRDDYFAGKVSRILLNQRNAIDPENVALLLARALTDRPDHTLYYMYFGNGGATVDPLGNVVFNPPLTYGNADLYNPTFHEIVDDKDGATGGNHLVFTHVAGSQTSTAVVYCVLGINEPLYNDNYIFNELGLKSKDDLLLTHITFTPITKVPGRIVQIIYSLLITIDAPSPPVSPLIFLGLQAESHVGVFSISAGFSESRSLVGVSAGAHVGTMSPIVVTNFILREDGSYVLREDGSRILREHDGP